MGLGRRIKRATDLVYTGPDSFTSSQHVSLFGPGDTGGIASANRIEALPAVYRAINLLCGVAQMLPLRARYWSNNELVPRTNPNTKAMYAPTGNWTFSPEEWRAWEMRCRLTRGNSFFYKVGTTGANPYPQQLLPLHPDKIMVAGVYRDGILLETLYVINKNLDTFMSWDQVVDSGAAALTRREVFHVPGAQFNGVSGISPIDATRQSLSAEALTEDANGAFYKSGSMMSGFLKTDAILKDGQAEVMKQRWQQKVAGAANAYEVAVLDGGVTFEPLTVKPADAQWIESRKFNLQQIARVFGVPPFMLMDSSAGQSFGTGLDTQLTALELFTFNEWLNGLESRYTMEILPSTMYAKSDRTMLERADVKTLHAAFAIGRQNGYMAINEIRDRLGLPRINDDDADDPMLPSSAKPAADEPGGNDGLQGGGEEASPDVVNN